MIKIAISGKANSGKNTLSSLLIKNFNFADTESKTLAFADPMKRILEIMFPDLKKECLYGKSELRQNIISQKYKDKKGMPLTYRQALIDFGKYSRQYNDNMWVNILEAELSRLNNDNTKLVIINDVRFLCEYSFLKKEGFFTIRVKRDGLAKISDPSETQQDEISDKSFDFVIHNNSTIDDLNDSVKLLIFNRFAKT